MNHKFTQYAARTGSVVATVPLVIIVLIVVAVFMVDYGSMQAERSSMQNAADAAALAAAMRIGNVNSESAREEAEQYASAFANYNQRFEGDVLSTDDIVFGQWDPATETFAASDDSLATAMQVTVIRGEGSSNYLTTPFLNFFGVDGVTGSVTAIARMAASSSATAVPLALRSPDFGMVVPELTDANPDDDGPSYPFLDRFEVDDEVIVMMYGNENVAHLTLNFGANGPGSNYDEVKAILSNNQDSVRMQVGDECQILSSGRDPDEFAQELIQRLSLAANDPNRTIVMPIVETIDDSRDQNNDLTGDVRVGDFVPVYLNRTETRTINDPDNSSQQIQVNVIVGNISTKRVNTDWGGASPSGVGGNTLRVIELVQ